mmetsp:Transcript_9323/g.15718  ORF Transcript_9323/g.15718 Transcript_9323/m.15718 type:complete len:119 (-) Transcript_9323:44-400(-)
MGLSAQHAHPLEHLLANFIPSMMGFIVLGERVHAQLLVTWLTLRVLETLEGHGGYEFPWSIFQLIPFAAGPQYHYFHHTKNAGNYSSFTTVWDTILDSNKDFYDAYPEEKPAKLLKTH